MLPPLDAHAHISTAIGEGDLRALHAAVFAVTRDPREWNAAAARRDRLCAWGLGCHPKIAKAIEGFDPDRLKGMVTHVSLLGEVGLDARSIVPMARQRQVFQQVLRIAAEHPIPVSIHSFGATSLVLDDLRICPIPGAVLHWWRGDPRETRAAVEAGCWFSVNGAEVAGQSALHHIPNDRVLTETDFPNSQRRDPVAARPGAITTAELTLRRLWGRSAADVRNQVWVNLAQLLRQCGSSPRMPRGVQAILLSLPRQIDGS